MPEKLLFTDARVRKWTQRASLPGKLENLLEKSTLGDVVVKGEPVALKIHFGSQGAFRTIRPSFVRRVVDAVKKAGGKPFVTDTVRIKGIEYLDVAAYNGFCEQTLGAPVVLADGLFGKDYVKVPCGGIMPFAPVASCIHDSPSMIVLTHCKGHVQAGYAGAIKNLAMGGVSAQNREDAEIRKKIGRPGMHLCHKGDVTFDESLCEVCGQCVDACPMDALQIIGGKLVMDRKKCFSCCRCARVCHTGAMKAPEIGNAFQEALAHVAKAVLSTFEPGRVFYLNFLMDMQPECDCMPGADVPVLGDAGILAGRNPCAIDAAACDIMKKSTPLPGSALFEAGCTAPGRDPWEVLHGRSGREHIEKLAEVAGLALDYEIEALD